MAPQFNEKSGPALRRILVEDGRSVLRDPSRLRHLLADYCPGARLEMEAILAAVDEGIPQAMLEKAELGRAQAADMARRLEAGRGLARGSAEWAVETWAFALERSLSAGPEPSARPDPSAGPEPAAPAKRAGRRWLKISGAVLAILLVSWFTVGSTSMLWRERRDVGGSWTGSAEAQVCGQPGGSRQVSLDLGRAIMRDDGVPFGADTYGELSIDSKDDGITALQLEGGGITTEAGRTRPADASLDTDSRASYSLDLKPGDRWAGFGSYQTLTGTLKRPASTCSDRGGEGEVLTVTLKKQ
jgi:hypothetical protein